MIVLTGVQVVGPPPVRKSKKMGVGANKVAVLQGADGVVRYVLAFLVKPPQQPVAPDLEQLVVIRIATLVQPCVHPGFKCALLSQRRIAGGRQDSAYLVGFELYRIVEAFKLIGGIIGIFQLQYLAVLPDLFGTTRGGEGKLCSPQGVETVIGRVRRVGKPEVIGAYVGHRGQLVAGYDLVLVDPVDNALVVLQKY